MPGFALEETLDGWWEIIGLCRVRACDFKESVGPFSAARSQRTKRLEQQFMGIRRKGWRSAIAQTRQRQDVDCQVSLLWLEGFIA